MLLSSSQNGTNAAAVVAVLLVLLVLGFALVRYVEWSSNARFAEFMSTSAPHSAPIPPHKGRTGCEQGKRPLPSELLRPIDWRGNGDLGAPPASGSFFKLALM